LGKSWGILLGKGYSGKPGFWWWSIVEKRRSKRASILSVFTINVDTEGHSFLFLVIDRAGTLRMARGKHGTN
jgi:hypothetical protein